MTVVRLYQPVNTRRLRYSGEAMAAFKADNSYDTPHTCGRCKGTTSTDNDKSITNDKIDSFSNRICASIDHKSRPALKPKKRDRRAIGRYPLTSSLSPWVAKAMLGHIPSSEVFRFAEPFLKQFHAAVAEERDSSSGLHDLNLVEFTYQVTLEVGAAILLAANRTTEPVEQQPEFHSSKASNDDHLASWGQLLTGLECDPPIIAMFPVYLMMCRAFTLEASDASAHADYVYSALTGVDWVKEKNQFKAKVATFENLAHSSVPNLDDTKSGADRSFWRISQAYLKAMNDCENKRQLKTPRQAALNHGLGNELVIVARGFDTIGSAYMCSDGAAYLDDAGIDSLVGSAIPNDVMDLHTDIWTGETRNTIRLIYPDGLTIEQAMKGLSTMLSAQLCELFRGHQRARFAPHREDGRIAASSPAYSFCRARHRRIFEVMELYVSKYGQKFWDWTWEIYDWAKAQVTEAALKEPLICGLIRSVGQGDLPPSTPTKFYNSYYELIDDSSPGQLQKKNPLGVTEDLAQITCDLHKLWHTVLMSEIKAPGWGRRFDEESDRLFGEAGKILLSQGEGDNAVEKSYRFGIAYGRLSMTLPYIAYHTIDAIILAYGAL